MTYKRMQLFITVIISQLLFSYQVGDAINMIDQNKTFEICYNGEGEMKLADYNGDLNGGNYHIIFIDMGASW